MRTFDKIITKANCSFGAPMGRSNVGTLLDDCKNKTIFDCKVPLSEGYDKGGVYWGMGSELRVAYTKDLNYINFYRVVRNKTRPW